MRKQWSKEGHTLLNCATSYRPNVQSQRLPVAAPLQVQDGCQQQCDCEQQKFGSGCWVGNCLQERVCSGSFKSKQQPMNILPDIQSHVWEVINQSGAREVFSLSSTLGHKQLFLTSRQTTNNGGRVQLSPNFGKGHNRIKSSHTEQQMTILSLG
jgi:hypothetical protein